MGVQWAVLFALSAAFVLVLQAVHVPAALLIGPMAAAIIVAVAGGVTRVPPHPFTIAQALMGCMIARSIPLATLQEILKDWPLFLAGVLSVIAAANTLGWSLAKAGVLPGATAIWGSSPGAASAIMLMAEANGADARLVAVMQYSRIVVVALVASAVATMFGGAPHGHAAAMVWFPPVDWVWLAATLALALVSAFVAARLPIPAGSLLAPLVVGVLLQDTVGMRIELPPTLLATSYALIGWSIGLRFTRPIFVYTARVLPRMIASILALVAICGAMAGMLVLLADVDPLTAYLATSPGGADSVAIIAASIKVDVPFVMAMQTARLVVVILIGPTVARIIAEKTMARAV